MSLLTPVRQQLLGRVAAAIPDPHVLGRPVRVAVDGIDGAGKTHFADELAAVMEHAGRPVVQVSVDGFHHQRQRRYARGRYSAEGFWLDSYNYDRFIAEVLKPFGPGGSRKFRRAIHDVETDRMLDLPLEEASVDVVLIVDGIFLHRDELVHWWDFSLYLHVDFNISVPRMAKRDNGSPDLNHTKNRRYIEGQRVYLAVCDPAARASLVIDNTDLAEPTIATPPPAGAP